MVRLTDRPDMILDVYRGRKTTMQQCNMQQVKFCKQYCGLSLNVADYFTLGECGRLPLCTTYMSNCIKYWLKVIRMQDFRYPEQSYFILKRLDDVGRKTWASCIRELSCMYGFGYLWIAHDVGNEAYFFKFIQTTNN